MLVKEDLLKVRSELKNAMNEVLVRMVWILDIRICMKRFVNSQDIHKPS